jgi:hypothetical protein
MRAGELVRSVYLSRRSKNTASFLLATCLAEGVVDVVVLVVLGSIALSGMNTASGVLLYANRILMLAGLFGLSALILLPRIGKNVVRTIAGWRFLTDGQKEKLGGWIAQFMLGLRSLLSVRRILIFLLLTALILCTDAVIVLLLGAALRIPILVGQALNVITVTILGGIGLWRIRGIRSTPQEAARAEQTNSCLLSRIALFVHGIH